MIANHKEVEMASPWMIYFRKLDTFFRNDDSVNVTFDKDNNAIKIYVTGEAKAEALGKLLPSHKSFGNVIIDIIIYPANTSTKPRMELLKTALEGNKAVSYIQSMNIASLNDFNFIVFVPKVVQYYNDDTSDINGICSTLYQDLAKDLFGEQAGIFFCTDLNNDE